MHEIKMNQFHEIIFHSQKILITHTMLHILMIVNITRGCTKVKTAMIAMHGDCDENYDMKIIFVEINLKVYSFVNHVMIIFLMFCIHVTVKHQIIYFDVSDFATNNTASSTNNTPKNNTNN